MRYSVQKAAVMIRSNIRIYVWIVVELALITGVLVLADATHRSADREIRRLSDIYREQELYIDYYFMDGSYAPGERADCGITLEDFLFLRERYSGQAAFRYYVYDNLYLFGNVVQNMYLVWGSEEFFEEQFGRGQMEFGSLAGYMGPEAGAMLSGGDARVSGSSVIEVGRGSYPDSLKIGGAEYRFELLDLEGMIPVSQAGAEIDSSRCLFLPIEERPGDWRQSNVNTNLSVCFEDFREAPQLVQEMITLLMDRHEWKFSYGYSDVLNNYISRAEDILNEIDLFSFIARVCLCVAVFGITGIMALLIRRRRKAYAVSLACGARRWDICAELLFEVFMVCGAGSVLGCLLGFLLTRFQLQSTFQVYFFLSCVSVPALLSLVIPLLTGIVILPDVNAVNPVETMKSE